MSEALTIPFQLRASDVTGQNTYEVPDVTPEGRVGDLVRSLLGRMGLVERDPYGKPIEYRARLEREGRHLHGSERVGDALRADDEIVLTPRIQAGRGAERL
jgi:hypothetical protein